MSLYGLRTGGELGISEAAGMAKSVLLDDLGSNNHYLAIALAAALAWVRASLTEGNRQASYLGARRLHRVRFVHLVNTMMHHEHALISAILLGGWLALARVPRRALAVPP